MSKKNGKTRRCTTQEFVRAQLKQIRNKADCIVRKRIRRDQHRSRS